MTATPLLVFGYVVRPPSFEPLAAVALVSATTVALALCRRAQRAARFFDGSIVPIVSIARHCSTAHNLPASERE